MEYDLFDESESIKYFQEQEKELKDLLDYQDSLEESESED